MPRARFCGCRSKPWSGVAPRPHVRSLEGCADGELNATASRWETLAKRHFASRPHQPPRRFWTRILHCGARSQQMGSFKPPTASTRPVGRTGQVRRESHEKTCPDTSNWPSADSQSSDDPKRSRNVKSISTMKGRLNGLCNVSSWNDGVLFLITVLLGPLTKRP